VTRDDKGRFAKGNGGGPGRKPRAVEQSYLDVTMGAVSLDDWAEIIGKAVAQAKRGDPVARKWLGDYLVGTPVQYTKNESEVKLTVNGFEDLLRKVWSGSNGGA